jgi:peptidoglycan/LPS O-acetylase OafA/YrhL
MGRGLSVYLDLLRLLAALQVVLYHLSKTSAVGLGPHPLSAWGHEAVIVFFVLSGFVIHHAARTRDHDLTAYLASRISRLYSVALPCLLLTLLFDIVTMLAEVRVFQGVDVKSSLDAPGYSVVLNLLMLGQSWVSVGFFSNGPYWSVAYEFWYYILFAGYFYCAGRTRWLFVGGAALLAGPQILALLPAWIAGALAYSERRSKAWPRWMVWLAAVQPLAVFGCYVAFDLKAAGLDLLGYPVTVALKWSSCVLTDTLLAVSFAVHLMAAKQLDGTLSRLLGRAEAVIRFGAARSFTLYLMHLPLMFMLAALSARLAGGPLPWLIISGTIIVPMLLAPAIENQRHAWRPWIANRLAQWLRPPAAVSGPVSHA